MLKYLFKVVFTDNSTYKQSPNDLSTLDPKKSSFYDILSSDKEVKTFEVGPLKVDLSTGEFTINGLQVVIGEPLPPFKRKLIFYRQHQHDVVNSYEANKKGIFSILKSDEVGHRVTYFLGYEVNIKDKVHKRIVGVK